MEPGIFRDVHALVQSSAEGLGRLEVVALAATGEAEGGDSGSGAALVGGVEALSLGAQRPVAAAAAQHGGSGDASRCGAGWVGGLGACGAACCSDRLVVAAHLCLGWQA